MSEIEFKKGFFECIAAADAEKVHSQTIGWILSDECGVFTQEERKSILQELLLGQNVNFDFGRIKSVDVEINDIDIQITCDNCLIVIENKLKSSQHSNQLFKYEYLTSNNEEEARHSFLQWKFPIEYKQWKKDNPGLEDKGNKFLEFLQNSPINKDAEKVLNKFVLNNKDIKKVIYFYLTLGDEDPKGTKGRWINVKYKKLVEVLEKFHEEVLDKSKPNYLILKDYIETLNRLTATTEKILEFPFPKELEFVFTEGKTKKGISVRNKSESQIEIYIRDLQLETLLQKVYYGNLLNHVEKRLGKIQKYKIESSSISETRGTALLDFFFDDVIFGNITYIPVLQFQGKAIKLGFSEKGFFYNRISPTVSNDEINIKEDRKNQFAEKIHENIDKMCMLEECTLEEIKNKLSTPKMDFGFMSFPLYDDEKYWQLNDGIINKVDFVLSYINYSFNILNEIRTK